MDSRHDARRDPPQSCLINNAEVLSDSVTKEYQSIQSRAPATQDLRSIPSIMEHLPPELLTEIAKLLDTQDLSSLAQTCQGFAQIVTQKSIWLYILDRLNQHRPLPLSKAMSLRVENAGFSVLNSDIGLNMTLEELRNAAWRASLLDAKLSSNSEVELTPVRVELALVMDDPCRWIWFFDRDQLVATMPTSRDLILWRKTSNYEYVENTNFQCNYTMIFEWMLGSYYMPRSWDFDCDDEGITAVINATRIADERNFMLVRRIEYQTDQKADFNTLEVEISAQSRANFLEDEVVGCIAGGGQTPISLTLADWKTKARVLICTDIWLPKHLSISSSKSHLVFYEADKSQCGKMYKFTMAIFRQLLKRAASSTTSAQTLIVSLNPQLVQTCYFKMPALRLLPSLKLPVPRIRRLWNGRRATVTCHFTSSSTFLVVAPIPQIDINLDHTPFESHHCTSEIQQVQGFKGTRFADASEAVRWRSTYVIGRGAKHMIWVKDIGLGLTHFSIAPIPYGVDASEPPGLLNESASNTEPVVLVWDHSNIFSGTWLDEVARIQFDDAFGYLFVGCRNGDVWKLSLV